MSRLLDDRKCPDCGDSLHAKAVSCACGWRQTQRRALKVPDIPEYELQCAWEHFGVRCGRKGCVSDATNGHGPWFCSEHYWHGLRKFPQPDPSKPPETYRERWYRERGIDYEPPKGGTAKEFVRREPGADEDYRYDGEAA